MQPFPPLGCQIAHPRDARCDLFQKFQPLSDEFCSGIEADPGHVAAWTSEAFGRSDILWRSDTGGVLLWLVGADGVTPHTRANLPLVDRSWQIEGAGDFDGDGRSDVLWRREDGALSLWFMDSAMQRGGADISGVDPSWQVQDTGDYNGDGYSDILWRHEAGGVSMWFMNGGTQQGGADLAPVDPSWKIVHHGYDVV